MGKTEAGTRVMVEGKEVRSSATMGVPLFHAALAERGKPDRGHAQASKGGVNTHEEKVVI